MFDAKTIQSLRADTPGTKERIHFNNAGASLMPTPIIAAIKQHIDLETKIGGYEAAAQEAEAIQGFYNSTAKLLNTKARNIAYTSNATDSYSKALSSIPFEQGDIILTTRQDYASNQIAFLQLAKRFGVQIVRAGNADSGAVDLDSVASLIRKHQPKLVAITHIPTNSGLIQPVGAIGEMCRKEDILYLVDACQSAGQVVLDVEKIRCDFLSVTMRKFMRGPRGAGYLFVSDKVLEMGLEPLFVDLKGATWYEANNYRPDKTAVRFELWERAYALVLASKAANKYALGIGMDKIEGRVKKLAKKIRDGVNSIGGYRVLDIGPELGGIVTLTANKVQPEPLKKALDARGINTAMAPLEAAIIDFQDKQVEWAIRISPHYYNTNDEIEELLDCLKSML